MSSKKDKVKHTKSTKNEKPVDEKLFDDVKDPNEDEVSSDYSDLENDLNNDDSAIIAEAEAEVVDEEVDEEEVDEDGDGDEPANINDCDGDDDEEDEDLEYSESRNKITINQPPKIIKIIKLTKKEDFISQNILTRFEQAAMICNRAAHLEMGAPPLVDTHDQTDELGITIKEFKMGKIPFTVARTVGNRMEWHSASDMQLNAHIQNILKDN